MVWFGLVWYGLVRDFLIFFRRGREGGAPKNDPPKNRTEQNDPMLDLVSETKMAFFHLEEA